jgi:hypothetical protein
MTQATKYLQLRVHSLKCIKETQNRQNFLGIPLETDPDSIDLKAVIVDGGEGVVALPPTVFLGNQYRNGRQETFPSPKVLLEVPVRQDDVFPRRVKVSLHMAEKDDGAGFDELMERVGDELAEALGDKVGEGLPADVTSNALYDVVEDAAGDLISALLKEFTALLGLGDDPFRPVEVGLRLDSFSAAPPAGIKEAAFYEPNPAHKGEFRLGYSWQLNEAPMTTAARTARTGDTAAVQSALTAAGYPRGYRTRRFRRAARASAPHVAARQILRMGGRKFSFMATPIRLFGAR